MSERSKRTRLLNRCGRGFLKLTNEVARLFRGVVFDFDGVIVDSHPVHKRAWQKFLESVGRVASDEELQFVLDGRKREDILRHFLGELSEEELVEYGSRKEQIFRDEATSVRAIEGLVDFLEDVKHA